MFISDGCVCIFIALYWEILVIWKQNWIAYWINFSVLSLSLKDSADFYTWLSLFSLQSKKVWVLWKNQKRTKKIVDKNFPICIM